MTPDRIESEVEFAAAVVEGVRRAVELRVRELWFADGTFEAWPLDAADLLGPLTQFVRLPGRRLMLLGQRFESLRRRRPRFTQWRATWSHAVAPLEPVDDGVEIPCVLLGDRSFGLHIVGMDPWEGGWLSDRGRLQVVAERIQAVQRRAQPAFPVNVAGL